MGRTRLGYLSEIERGQKEASSELLASICEALDMRLSELLMQVAPTVAQEERFEVIGSDGATSSATTALV